MSTLPNCCLFLPGDFVFFKYLYIICQEDDGNWLAANVWNVHQISQIRSEGLNLQSNNDRRNVICKWCRVSGPFDMTLQNNIYTTQQMKKRHCGAGLKSSSFFLGNPGNPREIATIRTVLQFCSFKIQQLLQTFVCFDQCCRRVLVKCSECVDFFFISLWMCKMSKNLGSLDDEQTLSASFSRFIQNDGCDGSSQSKFVERCQSRVSGALCG
jgi:hypothetical protein